MVLVVLIIDVHVLGWMDTSKTQVKVLYAARTLVDSVAVQFEWAVVAKFLSTVLNL